MPWLDLGSRSLSVSFALFAAAGVGVWLAGSRLALYADALAARTGWHRAFVGLVLLALLTDLPEVVTSVTAAAGGESQLAVTSLYGTVLANTVILAVADLCLGSGALTYFTASVQVTIQGLLVILLLALSLLGMVSGEPWAIGGVGVVAALGFVVYLAFVWRLARFDAGRGWRPMDLPNQLHPRPSTKVAGSGAGRKQASLPRLALRLGGAAGGIILAGLALVESATDIAHRTGLGTSFVGSTLLAAATSLPELSTTIGAVRIGAYGLAFGNIFGSNALAVALVLVVDIVQPGAPVLRMAGPSTQLAAVAGIGLASIYLVGLLARSRRSVLRMGLDSWVVLLAYGAVLYGFYELR